MSQNTYLVTGSMGCIGAWTLYHLHQNGHRIISFDLSESRHRLNLLLNEDEQTDITFIHGDLRDSEQISKTIREHQVTHIIHLAALQVPFCKANPILGAQVNVVGTVNIFQAALEAEISHISYASSIAVYGSKDEYSKNPIPHDADHYPHTLYGVYKVANENTARVYWQDYGISSTALRPYTVYGVGRDQGMTSEPTSAILAALKGEASHINFGGAIQFQLASDVAQQFILAAKQASQNAAAYNLGSPIASVAEFVEHIRANLPNANITIADTQLPFPEAFDDAALRAHADTIYETPLAEGVRQTIEHFQQCMDKGLL